MTLGLMFPVFLVGMAFLAVKSDAKNQAEYARQKAEMMERIKAKEAENVQLTQQQAASEAELAASEAAEK